MGIFSKKRSTVVPAATRRRSSNILPSLGENQSINHGKLSNAGFEPAEFNTGKSDYVLKMLGSGELYASRFDLAKLIFLITLEVVDITLDVTMFSVFYNNEKNTAENSVFTTFYVIHTILLSIAGVYSVLGFSMQIHKIRKEMRYGVKLSKERLRVNAEDGKTLLQEFQLARAARNRSTAKHIVLMGLLEDLVTLFLVLYRLFFTDHVFTEDVIKDLALKPEEGFLTNLTPDSQLVFVQIGLTSVCFFHKVLYVREIRELSSQITDNAYEIEVSVKRSASVLDSLMEGSISKEDINAVVEMRRLLEQDVWELLRFNALSDYQIASTLRKWHGNSIDALTFLTRWLMWREEYETRVVAIQAATETPDADISAKKNYMRLLEAIPFVDDGRIDSSARCFVQYISPAPHEGHEILESMSEAEWKEGIVFAFERIQLIWEHYVKENGFLLDCVLMVDATHLTELSNTSKAICKFVYELATIYPLAYTVVLYQPTSWLLAELKNLGELSVRIVTIKNGSSWMNMFTTDCIPQVAGGSLQYKRSELESSPPSVPHDAWELASVKYRTVPQVTGQPANFARFLQHVDQAVEVPRLAKILEYLKRLIDTVDNATDREMAKWIERYQKKNRGFKWTGSALTSSVNSKLESTMGGGSSCYSSHNSCQEEEETRKEEEEEASKNNVNTPKKIDLIATSPPKDKTQAHKLLKAWLAQFELTGIHTREMFNDPFNDINILAITRSVPRSSNRTRYNFTACVLKAWANRVNRNIDEIRKEILERDLSLSQLEYVARIRSQWYFDPLFEYDQVNKCIICMMGSRIGKMGDWDKDFLANALYELFEFYTLLRQRLSHCLGAFIRVQIVFEMAGVERLRPKHWKRFHTFIAIAQQVATCFPSLLREPFIGLTRRVTVFKYFNNVARNHLKKANIYMLEMERQKREIDADVDKIVWSWEWADEVIDCSVLLDVRKYSDEGQFMENPLLSMPLSQLVNSYG